METAPKQRSFFLTLVLIIAFIGNAILMLVYFFGNSRLLENAQHPEHIPTWYFPVMGVFSAMYLICIVMIYRWNILGFWGFVLTAVLTAVLNYYVVIFDYPGLSMIRTVLSIATIGVLFAALQTTKDGISAWQHMTRSREDEF